MDGFNQKPALGLLRVGRGTVSSFKAQPSVLCRGSFRAENLRKATYYQKKRGYLPNQVRHVVATSDLLPVRAGTFLWHDTAFCKKCLIGPACKYSFCCSMPSRSYLRLWIAETVQAPATLQRPSPSAKLNCFLPGKKKTPPQATFPENF